MKRIVFVALLLATIYAASAIEINPEDVWYNKSVSEFKNGSYSLALQDINKTLDQNPLDNSYWSLKVLILLKMSKYDSALSTLDDALNVNSSNSQALNDRGLLEAGYLHDYNRSIESFDRAIRLDPTNAKTYYNKGMTLENMGKYQDAILAFQQAVKLSPNFANAWNLEGLSYSALNQYDEALKCFDKATQLDRTNKDAWNNKGNALKALNRDAEANIAFSMAGKSGA